MGYIAPHRGKTVELYVIVNHVPPEKVSEVYLAAEKALSDLGYSSTINMEYGGQSS